MGIGLGVVVVATGAFAVGAKSASADGMCGPDGMQALGGDQVTCTFTDHTKRLVFHRPAGVSSVFATAEGASGGNAAPAGTDPGHGGFGKPGGIGSATLDLTNHPALYMFIGGNGGEPDLGCVSAGGRGGLSGEDSGGGEISESGSGGGGGQGTGTSCAGGGGGGGTFVMGSDDGTPADSNPLLVAGGGGGGGGGDAGVAGSDGGQGGGAVDTSVDGEGTEGGNSGDHGGTGGGGGEDGTRGSGGNGAAATAAGGGGGGGGGGYLGGEGGALGGGGGGGCGFTDVDNHCDEVPDGIASADSNAFHTAQIASVTFTFTLSNGAAPTNPTIPTAPANPANPANADRGGHHNGNDPNPNTNPQRSLLPTATALCNPQIGFCKIGPIVGPDSVFNVTAQGGTSRATLFGTLQGGSRPNCPGYAEMNRDWLMFGFQDPLAGSSWRKASTLTTRHRLARAQAVARSQKMQICFEAPYRFRTRPGYALGGHNALFDGVLPDCTGGGRRPCVSARQVLQHKGGWVVRLTFRVPANSQDPKALG
jgi:hypothetical protein